MRSFFVFDDLLRVVLALWALQPIANVAGSNAQIQSTAICISIWQFAGPIDGARFCLLSCRRALMCSWPCFPVFWSQYMEGVVHELATHPDENMMRLDFRLHFIRAARTDQFAYMAAVALPDGNLYAPGLQGMP